jgi:hypothetical protein
MAKTIVDAGAFSRDWFKKILSEVLLDSPRVKFVFTVHARMMEEVERNGDYGRLFKVLEGDPRRIVVSEAEFERLSNELLGNATWRANKKVCDDEHIFALVRAKNVPFVFSVDGRMAACRGCLRGRLDSKFASFTLISSPENFEHHKHAILR